MMNSKILILIFFILGIEPFLFYKIQLCQYDGDLTIYTILRVILFGILFIGILYIYIFFIVSVYTYFEQREWFSYQQVLEKLVISFLLIMSILPILIITKIGSILEKYKLNKISNDGKITTSFIHYNQGEYYTNRGGSDRGKGRYINYFDLKSIQGKIYQLEFHEHDDIFKPGDSIVVQYLESNPNYFTILKKYPSD